MMAKYVVDAFLQGILNTINNTISKAKELLKQIADQVQPIMRKRQFTCPLLVEFFPKNPQLLVC